ncbi:restriction endonuclease subunit S [Flavobacterium taihuense]|uniref:Restriction endonuclease subunit S n=1 Tax=Flavobacterium taihuense TaxID=2857508 RepID=A0ABS6XZ30_9FLAO|nr:restriction endonuclease subunit S [Flavobacterium taihuense]MBW4361083.1 restriction endonuclease subunit S [Flavobacterium taihuense]
MSNWRNVEIGKVIDFNPSESIKKGTIAKKIPMDKLKVFEKKINGFEFSEYSAGPKFRNGDTLVAKITPCLENGKTAQVDILEENEIAFGSSEFIVLRENENTINDFIFYLAKSPAFRKRAISCMEGTSGRKRVNEGALKLQVLPIPDKRIQKKIAKVFSDLDSKIELNNKINDNLEQMAKTLYDYWFVQFDFPDANGKPYKTSGGKMVWSDDLRREIPEGWEVKKIKDIAETGSGGTPLKSKNEYFENGNIPWINSGEVNASFIISSKKFITQKGIENSSAKLFERGTILMAMYGATAGQVSLIDIEASTNQAVCGIVPKDKRLVPYLKFGLHQLYDYLINLSSGSARDNLSQDKIKELYFVIPEDNLIKQFYKISNSHFEMILKNLKENQELASLRDWLLPMLMNGQITVKD